MFLENSGVSGKQIYKMLIFDIFSISMIAVPGIAVFGAGRDGVLAIILGSVAAVGYGFFFLYISKKAEGDYIEFGKKVFGKNIVSLIGISYLVKILFSCWFTLSLFCSVLNETLLPNMDYKIIIITFILLGIYMASKGIEVRARVSEILFYIVIIPLFLIFVFGMKNIEITNLFPLFTAGNREVIQTSYSVLIFYSSLEFLLFSLPFIIDRKGGQEGQKKGILSIVILTAVFNLILFALILGVLGFSDAGVRFESGVAILQVVGIPIGFFKRQDALILMFWLFCIFTLISAYFYYLSRITNSIIKQKSRYGTFACYGILVFFLCTIHLTPEKTMDYYLNYMAYVGMPLSIAIPILVLAVGKLKEVFKKKG